MQFRGDSREEDDKAPLLSTTTDTDTEKQHRTVQKRDKAAVLSYHNITYSLQLRYKGFACCAKYKSKEILRELRCPETLALFIAAFALMLINTCAVAVS